MSLLPLAGRRILVTRALHQAGKLSEGLRALGAEPVEVAVLEIRPPASFEPLDAALRQLAHYDWLVLTSANTVRALGERASALGIALPQTATMRVAAVGEATAASAHRLGFTVAIVPETYVAESLVKSLARQVQGKRVLLARAAGARDVIPDSLRAAGAQVDVVDAYRNVMPEGAPEQLRLALAEKIDAATFTSSSSATHLAEAARQAGIAWPFASVLSQKFVEEFSGGNAGPSTPFGAENAPNYAQDDRFLCDELTTHHTSIPAVSIGPITSRTLRDLGWEPAIEANPSDIPGLIAAVVQALRG